MLIPRTFQHIFFFENNTSNKLLTKSGRAGSKGMKTGPISPSLTPQRAQNGCLVPHPCPHKMMLKTRPPHVRQTISKSLK